MKAYIVNDTKSKTEDTLWLIVERGSVSAEIENIMGMFRDEDDANNMAYPILADEVEAIRDACEAWLEEKSQEIMKNNLTANDDE